MKSTITINNFQLFEDLIKSLCKVVDGAKFIINNSGVEIYSANSYARTEMTSTAITSSTPTEFCVNDVSMLQKIINTIKVENGDTTPELTLEYDGQFIKFKSNTIKSKIITSREEVIQQYVSKGKITTPLTPIFEFSTSSKTIKSILGNSFIFSDPDSARIYLKTNDEELARNLVYANIDNKNNPLSNSITLKLGMILSGDLNREIIIDMQRLSLFSIIDSDDIIIKLMDKNVLVSSITKYSPDNKYSLNIKIFNSIRKN